MSEQHSIQRYVYVYDVMQPRSADGETLSTFMMHQLLNLNVGHFVLRPLGSSVLQTEQGAGGGQQHALHASFNLLYQYMGCFTNPTTQWWIHGDIS